MSTAADRVEQYVNEFEKAMGEPKREVISVLGSPGSKKRLTVTDLRELVEKARVVDIISHASASHEKHNGVEVEIQTDDGSWTDLNDLINGKGTGE